MVRREIFRWEDLIGRSLRPSRLGAANPYHINIIRDVPKEIMDMIFKLSTTNMFATDIKETPAVKTLLTSNLSKVLSLILRANTRNMNIIKRGYALKRASSGQLFKAIVNPQKPFVLKYYKNRERAISSIYYGHWNVYGVPQHS